jgi:hypothetical protein
LSAEDQDSKTEAPSAKRLSEAHSKGQFARAPELTLVFTLAAALFTFGLAAREASDKMMRLAVVIFGRLGELRVQGDEVPVDGTGVEVDAHPPLHADVRRPEVAVGLGRDGRRPVCSVAPWMLAIRGSSSFSNWM